MKHRRWSMALALLALHPRGTALAQSGGVYGLGRNTIAGGGALSAGATYDVHGSIGQPAAALLSRESFAVQSGFWPQLVALTAATPTPSRRASPTRTSVKSATPSNTVVVTATPTPVPTIANTMVAPTTASATIRVSPTRTPTPSPTPKPTASASATQTTSRCAGDCDGDSDVTVNELVVMVNIALGNGSLAACFAGDGDGNGAITIEEVLRAVSSALRGCG